MSKYEIVSTIVSIVALILSIFIPLIQWLWKRFIIKPNIQFYPTGSATLFFNQSGSYLRVDGVIEAANKAVSVKKMSVKVRRKKDDKTLNLVWSHLISPVHQSLVGNYLQTTEKAHPFRVDADSIVCAFVEYADIFDSFGKAFRIKEEELRLSFGNLTIFSSDYNEAVKQYSSHNLYSETKELLKNEFFWSVGQYSLEITIDYNNARKAFVYDFSISESVFDELSRNIDESIVAPLKKQFQMQWYFRSPSVTLIDRKDNQI